MNHKPLSQSRLFWLTFIFGGLAATTAIIAITSNNNFILCTDVKCFSNFLEYYAIPIKIISATFFVAGFVAVIHRSNQTHHQIELTHEQNTFSNFYEHKKQFVDMLVQFSEEHEVRITGKHKLYSQLFPLNNISELSFTSKSTKGNRSELYLHIQTFNTKLELIKECIEWDDETQKLNSEICNQLAIFLIFTKRLGVYSTDNLILDKNDKKHFRSINELPKDFSGYFYIVRELIMALAYFSFSKEEADKIKLVSINDSRKVINQLLKEMQKNPFDEWL